jgi:diguanylate cyclase (GGDEF)-like protein
MPVPTAIDSLTGLPNRALFVDYVKSALVRSSGNSEKHTAVFFLDCDRFKLVNDSLGHMTGDLLLIAIARRLESCLRPGDALARLGGDEFAILLENVRDEAAAGGIGKRILTTLATPFAIGNHEVYASASIGIALGTSESAPESLLRDADIAMYRAKALGKNRYEVFEAKLREQTSRLLQLENELRRALDNAQLSIAYQPIVSLADGRLTAFEALARWRHPTLGNITPVEFIPVAEETGLIIPLGNWILHAACSQTRHWQQSSPEHAALSVNVNVSVKQLLDERFTERVRETLEETGLRAEHLHLEITESTLMTEPARIAAILRELHAIGVKLHADDFGTGYSSLAIIHQLPIDTLKIDRAFISGRGGVGIANPEIVQAVVVLAAHLGLDVIAEGVETAEQESQLGAFRCGNAQGYRYARPLEPLTVAQYLSTHAMHEEARPPEKRAS